MEKKRKPKPTWSTNPTEILGCLVEEKYGSKYFVGTIIDIDIDENTNEQIWRVLYDDGDVADYNTVQLQKIICLDQTQAFC